MSVQNMQENQAVIEIKVMAFGIARDILGGPSISMSIDRNTTARQFRDVLFRQYPAFADLTSLKIALNQSYATDDQIITENDEVVLIPPVCGG